MKFLEAAQEILRQNGNQPMTSKENDLHEEYDDFRKDREWFFYSKKIKEFRCIRKGYKL